MNVQRERGWVVVYPFVNPSSNPLHMTHGIEMATWSRRGKIARHNAVRRWPRESGYHASHRGDDAIYAMSWRVLYRLGFRCVRASVAL